MARDEKFANIKQKDIYSLNTKWEHHLVSIDKKERERERGLSPGGILAFRGQEEGEE